MVFGEKQIFEIFKPHGFLFFKDIWFAPLFCDLWRILSIKNAKWAVNFIKLSPYYLVKYGRKDAIKSNFWFHWWTPKWHDGRGPYLTIGLGFIRIVRGY